MAPVIHEHIEALVSLCKKYGVDRLYAFGSVLSEAYDPLKSDIDLQVEMEVLSPIERGRALLGLWEELEKLFQKNVDLLTDRPIRNPYLRKSIEENRRLIYDRRSEKIFV